MTKFSATLQAQMRQEYRDQYVNYKGLKKKIKKTREQAMGTLKDNQSLKQRVQEIKQNPNESQAYEDLMMTPVGEAQGEFLGMLDNEVERTSDFFASLTRKGIRDCNMILKNRGEWTNSHDHLLNAVIEKLTTLGNELVHSCHFAELNITAVRKILKKFDKKYDAISIPIAQRVISNKMRQPNSKLLQLLNLKVVGDIYLILEDCHI